MKKVYILAKDIDSKRKFQIKAKKCWLEKGLLFWVTLIVSKTFRQFHQYFFFLQNISTLKNQPLPITTSIDKRTWGP